MSPELRPLAQQRRHSKCLNPSTMSLDLDFNSDDDLDLPLENKDANPKTSNAASKFAQFMYVFSIGSSSVLIL
jgi:hypothetical protein